MQSIKAKDTNSQGDGSTRQGNFFFVRTELFFCFFLSLFFVMISSIFVKFKLHEFCAMREAPGTSGLKLNLLRWLVCLAVVLNLNVQVAHFYKNITMVFLRNRLCKNTIGEATLGLYWLTEQIKISLALGKVL